MSEPCPNCAPLKARTAILHQALIAQIKHMVDRFLSWRLPEDFHPDNGISFDPVHSKGTPYEGKRQPNGTNLFNATQATEMVRHMVDGMPTAEPTDRQRRAMEQLRAMEAGAEPWGSSVLAAGELRSKTDARPGSAAPPIITREQIRDALARGAKEASETHERLKDLSAPPERERRLDSAAAPPAPISLCAHGRTDDECCPGCVADAKAAEPAKALRVCMPKEFWDATKAVAPPAQQPETRAAYVADVQNWADLFSQMRAERDALREKLAAIPTLWTCPRCAFSFDAIHADGSCPCCEEAALGKENAALRERLSRAREWTEDDVERVVGDAQAAITLTLDNEARAISKGSAPYSDSFRRAALANNVSDAIAAALSETPSTQRTPEGT